MADADPQPTDPETTDAALADEASPDDSVDETLEFKPAEAEPTVEERLAESEDRVLRLQAELQNVLNRTSRQIADERKYGAIGLIRDLLPAIDNIDRALEAAEKSNESTDAGGLLEGFKLVRQQLVTLLGQNGCQPIETDGAEFDPDLHEAILQQPSSDVDAGKILMTTQTGFRLHERVVRPAQVIVSSGAGG